MTSSKLGARMGSTAARLGVPEFDASLNGKESQRFC
jgi:hypothetical protein